MSDEAKTSKEETIAAIATAAGKSGVGIVRVSGPSSLRLARALTKKEPQNRIAEFTHFYSSDNSAIDSGLLLYFQQPASYTGEDVVELHCHGSPAILSSLLQSCLENGARLARPGEFTERAYLNGKLNLSQAEAVADLIDSTSSRAAKSAVRTLQGRFSKEVHSLNEDLVSLRVYVEGALDFPEEETDFISEGNVAGRLGDLSRKLEAIYEKGRQGKKFHDGYTIAILGKPNTGKSSLLNYLSGFDAAIVTDIPGTTRDLLEQDILLDGILFRVIDTAGIRDSQDPVEQEGISRAREAAKSADILVIMTEATEGRDSLDLLERNDKHQCVFLLRNKIDLIDGKPSVKKLETDIEISLSVKTEEGLDLFLAEVKKIAGEGNDQGCYTANERHLQSLQQVRDILQNSIIRLNKHGAAELLAEDLKQAQTSLGEITGEFYPDDLLGEIFSRFCIGK